MQRGQGVERVEKETKPRNSVAIPVVRETIRVGKRVREVGKTAVRVRPRQKQQIVDVPVAREEVHVARVRVNRFVDAPPPVRQEGDVTIVSVVEEVVVVQKRLRVKEELHITKRRGTRRHREMVTLREEQAEILRS
jgi:stress response protein YsnF